ncbi:MAG: hypothetical protein IKN59_05135 [Paludibacteraceae bacterium]|nr:hypothetical protein [Paludibacteraceae bacterium]
MKKIFTLLLLGGLLFFGVQSAWADTDVYSVVGDKTLVGSSSNWEVASTATNMTYNATWGKYVYTRNNISLTAGNYDCKVVKNHDYDKGKWPNDKNYTVNIGADDYYDVMFLFDLGANSVEVRVCTHTIKLNNDFSGTGWVQETFTRSDDYLTCSIAKSVPSTATYHGFDVVINGTYFGNYNFYRSYHSGTITTSKAAELHADMTGQYIFTYTYNGANLDITYPEQPRTGLTAGNYGTICLSKAVPASSISGATFYNIYGKNAESNPSELWLVEETGDLVAGQPYIFKATGTAITVTYTGEAASAGYNNGLYGTLSAKTTSDMNTLVGTEGKDIYLLSGNKVVKAGTDCTLSAGRAYIDMAQVPCPASGPSPSAIRFDLDENNTTSINAIEASEKAVKIFENGQMYILRSGVKYDATGRVVK